MAATACAESRTAAVCVTGLFRSANYTLHHLRRQYPPDMFAVFVVTDGVADPSCERAVRIRDTLEPTRMHSLEAINSSQQAGLQLCASLIAEHETTRGRRFEWVARQRIDTLGCTPSWPDIASPARHKAIVVDHARCGWTADNWAFMSRDVLELYASSIRSEKILGRGLLAQNVSVWTPASTPCFRIVRESHIRFQSVPGAAQYQVLMREPDIALALNDTTRPVSFHRQVCPVVPRTDANESSVG